METNNVTYETTPNPQSMKYSFSSPISEQSFTFKSAQETTNSPLAAKIFGFPWTQEIFLGSDFITITKQDWVEWEILAEPLKNLIQEHIDNDEPITIELKEQDVDPNDSPEVQLIKKVLRDEIRPQVAMDGGDIQFVKYEENIVFVRLVGACSGCPSANVTLKSGVEARLKHHLPEVHEVVDVQ